MKLLRLFLLVSIVTSLVFAQRFAQSQLTNTQLIGKKIERSDIFCKTEAEAKDPNNPCKCYCSVKCGPRKKRPGIDPIIFDKQLGIPWCQERDVRLYHPNKCALKTEENKKS